jgi:hypothetical protein
MKWTKKRLRVTIGTMSSPDAVPLPRLGEVFFDVRGSSRSMRLSWYSDSAVAVFSIWQGGVCTGTFRLAIDDLPRMVQMLRSGPGAAVPAGSEPGPAPERQQAGRRPGYQQQPEHAQPPLPGPGQPDQGYPATLGTGYQAPYRPGEEYHGPGYNEPADRRGRGNPGDSYRQSGAASYPETTGHARDPAGYAQDPAGYAQDPAGYAQDPAGYAQGPAGYPRDPAGYVRDPADYARDPAARGDEPAYAPGYAERAGYAESDTASGYRHADTAPTDSSYRKAESWREMRGSHRSSGPETGSPAGYPGPGGVRGDDRGSAAGYAGASARGNGYPDGAYAAPGRQGNGYGPGRGPDRGDPAGQGRRGANSGAGHLENLHITASQSAGYPEPRYPESAADGNHRAGGPAWPEETPGTRYRAGDDSASHIGANGYGDSAGADGVPAADSFTYPQLAGSASGAERHWDSRRDVP